MTFNITTNVAFAGKKMSVDRHINYCSFWQVWQSDETFALQKFKKYYKKLMFIVCKSMNSGPKKFLLFIVVFVDAGKQAHNVWRQYVEY